MAQTPSSSATAYCSATRLFELFDRRGIADLVRDTNASAPTRAAMLDSTDACGAVVVSGLNAAAGLIEAACTQGNRYGPTDLAALTGVSKAHLERINAGLAIQGFADRRPTASVKTDLLSAIAEANKMLDRLRTGEHVFGLVESQEPAQRMDGVRLADDTTNQTFSNSIVSTASRYFGNRTPRG